MTAEVRTYEDTYRDTLSIPAAELVRQLNSHLGATLVAVIAGVKDRRLPYKWQKADGPRPRDSALQRLMVAHRAWRLISEADDDHTARAWFIGANPRLNEVSPAVRLNGGDTAAVMAAAKAFAGGGE